MQSTFKIQIRVPRHVAVGGQSLSRDSFYSWAWENLQGLQGINEGTLLSEQAVEAGLETESWTVDSGEAPRERDWIGGQPIEDSELHFGTREEARDAHSKLSSLGGLELGAVEEVAAQDWDAQWKASFTGAQVKPFWHVLPPWMIPSEVAKPGEVVLRLNPGAGFGTGTHETTQLCLELIGGLAVRNGNSLQGTRALDFGSGSGILSVAAALLGAEVDGVEIDPLAIDNAEENASLNSISAPRVQFTKTLGGARRNDYELVIANILKPVLLEFASTLTHRLAPGGVVILSGLVEKDVEDVRARYSELLDGRVAEVHAQGEWRALIWRS